MFGVDDWEVIVQPNHFTELMKWFPFSLVPISFTLKGERANLLRKQSLHFKDKISVLVQCFS